MSRLTGISSIPNKLVIQLLEKDFRDINAKNWVKINKLGQQKWFSIGNFTNERKISMFPTVTGLLNLKKFWNETKSTEGININPCSPEGFSQTYFPKGGCCNPPLDYQYWRSYNPKFTTSV